MATNKDTENNSPSAPAPADNDIAKLTEIAEQDIDEAIEDEFGTIYSKDGKRLFEFNKDLEGNEDDLIIRDGTEIICDDAFSDCTYLIFRFINHTTKCYKYWKQSLCRL